MSLPAPDVRAEAAEELLGQTLSDRFRLDSILGHGAMGAVFKAYHQGLKKDVALKLLHRELTANDEMVARFDREAAAASRLDHPNCVRIMDFGSTDDGRRYLVMECLEGKDLAEIVTGPMPPFRVVEMMRQVLEGLAHAHAQGLVHRDIKPENIFVVGGEGGEQVKLLDFGIAKVTHGAGASQLTRAGMIFGTPFYMSPEQARGETTDARSDLYALGIVMYSMLAGKLPFEGDDPVAILRRQIAETPAALPDSIPGSLRHFVMRLLAKKPEERFADATAAIAALRRAAAPTDRGDKPKLPPPPRLAGLLPRPKGGLPSPVKTMKPQPPKLESEEEPNESDEPDAAEPTEEAAPDETEDVEELFSEEPALEELVALEKDQGEADKKGPPPPPVVPGGTLRVEAETQPESEAATAPPEPPAAPAAAAPIDRPPWVLPAIGVGAVGLLLLVVAAWPDDDKAETESKAAVADGATKDEPESKPTKDEESDAEPAAPEGSDELVIEDDAPADEPAAEDEEPEPKEAQSARALRANLASIDALMESNKYDAARITIGPLLEVYDDEPALHWRMGRVLVALGRKANATPALESYRAALSLDAGLIEDEEFANVFWDLLDDPRHRALSTEIAIELLGDKGHDRLAKWVNVQKGPLPYASRHAVMEHLRGAQQADRINEPLQTALDLWQASTTKAPCEAFRKALDAASEHYDSYLAGSLAQVSVPTVGEGDEATECADVGGELTSVREEYAQRYAGLDPMVPAAYKRRKAPAKSNNRRRRR